MLKSVIFDFNGTLFWDTSLHNLAWDEYLKGHGRVLTDVEKNNHIHGKSGKDIFEYLFERPLSTAEVSSFTEEKESIYRSYCEKMDVSLAPGAEDLLHYLATNNIPFGIATASGKPNVDYFYQKFELYQYLPMEAIVFDDGKILGKPHPNMFLELMKRLGIPPERTICFEDSKSGILAAENAGIDRTIIVDSTGKDLAAYKHPIIKNFNDFDKNELTLLQ